MRNWWVRSGLAVRIAVSAFVVGVGLALVFAILFLAITGLRHRSLEARHSQQVIATANELQTLVIDLETGVRGFVLTSDKSYLRPWVGAQKRYPGAIKKLLSLTKNDPGQQQRALSIKRAIGERTLLGVVVVHFAAVGLMLRPKSVWQLWRRSTKLFASFSSG